MPRKYPHVIIKIAQSLDGKIATRSGSSKWISSPESRKTVQMLRKKVDAILIGSTTLKKDNPRLNVRISSRKQPAKIILDTKLVTQPSAKIFHSQGKVIIATSKNSSKQKRTALARKAQLLISPMKHSRIALKPLLGQLRKLNIKTILVEGGGEVVGCFMDEGLAQELYLFVAPKIIGGNNAQTSVAGSGIKLMQQATKLKKLKVKKIGPDYLFHGYF